MPLSTNALHTNGFVRQAKKPQSFDLNVGKEDLPVTVLVPGYFRESLGLGESCIVVMKSAPTIQLSLDSGLLIPPAGTNSIGGSEIHFHFVPEDVALRLSPDPHLTWLSGVSINAKVDLKDPNKPVVVQTIGPGRYRVIGDVVPVHTFG
jgi:hypothetical protein